MAERRHSRTPFSYRPFRDVWGIYGTDDQAVAFVLTEQHAAFICIACNRYDALMAAFDLCRGEMNGFTQPHHHPSRKAFHELALELTNDIEKNGR